MATPAGGKSGLQVLSLLLVLLAVTGKFAFLTLSKQPNPDVLLQAGHGTKLERELSHLEHERAELAHKYAMVTEEEEKRAARAREKHALFAKGQEHILHLAAQERAQLKSLHAVEEGLLKVHDAGEARDEAAVAKLVKNEFEHERLAAKRRQQALRRAASEREYKAELAWQRREQEQIETEAKAEAKKELREAGLLPDPRKSKFEAKAQQELQEVGLMPAAHALSGHAERAQEELAEHAKNEALERDNEKLAEEARHMQVTLQWAPKQAARSAVGVGGETGIGDPLAKAGVVENSWGPITSTADTRPDPRDSFAKDPNRDKGKYTGAPYVVGRAEKAELQREKLHVLPWLAAKEKRARMASKDAKLSEGALEKDLGFTSSVLMSKEFGAQMSSSFDARLKARA